MYGASLIVNEIFTMGFLLVNPLEKLNSFKRSEKLFSERTDHKEKRSAGFAGRSFF